MSFGLPLGVVIEADFTLVHPETLEPITSGREQRGVRPAVIVGVPELVAAPRFPGVVVVPFSSRVHNYPGERRALYPIFEAGIGGLPRRSVALVENVRFMDRSRMLPGAFGRLTEVEFERIRGPLRQLLGL